MTDLDIEIIERDNNIPPEKSILANRRLNMTMSEKQDIDLDEFVRLVSQNEAREKLLKSNYEEFCRNPYFFAGMISELTVYLKDNKTSNAILKKLHWAENSDFTKGEQFMYDILCNFRLV